MTSTTFNKNDQRRQLSRLSQIVSTRSTILMSAVKTFQLFKDGRESVCTDSTKTASFQ
jgi:hypothetical protein